MKFNPITTDEALCFGIEARSFPFELDAELAPAASADVQILNADLAKLKLESVAKLVHSYCKGDPRRLVVWDLHQMSEDALRGDFWTVRSIFRKEDVNDRLIPWPIAVPDLGAAVEHSPLVARPPRNKVAVVGPYSGALLAVARNVATWRSKIYERIDAEVDVLGFKAANKQGVCDDLAEYPAERLIESFRNARLTVAGPRFQGGNLARRVFESASGGRPCLWFNKMPNQLPMVELGADYSWLRQEELDRCAWAGQIVALDRHLDHDDPGINAKARACWEQFLSPAVWATRLPQLLVLKLRTMFMK